MEHNASGQADAPQSFLTKAQQVALDAALLTKEKAARAITLRLYLRVGLVVAPPRKMQRLGCYA